MCFAGMSDVVGEIVEDLNKKRKEPLCPICIIPMEDLGEPADDSGVIPYWICPQHGGVIRYEEIEESEKEKAKFQR